MIKEEEMTETEKYQKIGPRLGTGYIDMFALFVLDELAELRKVQELPPKSREQIVEEIWKKHSYLPDDPVASLENKQVE
jgi:hypothetical protein